MRRFGRLSMAGAMLALAAQPVRAAEPDPRIAARFMKITRATRWTPIAAIPLRFRTFHPQGMVRVGENFYLSSVEITVLPRRYVTPQDGHDRTTGSGIGHLFKIGPGGALLADLVLGEGAIYHPGGIDFDGSAIWVPVSEYRPNSRAMLYRVDPATMRATEMLRVADHIGGVVHDTEGGVLHGLSWGSRTFYAWPLGADGHPSGAATPGVANPEQYIDYQDCHHVGAHRMLCSGVGEYRDPRNTAPFQLGGIDLVDLNDHRPVWQAPVDLRSPGGRSMTQNPFYVEATAAGLRAYFIPDDDASTLFVFDVAVD